MTAPALVVAIPLLIGVLLGTSHGVAPALAASALLICWSLAVAALWRGQLLLGPVAAAAGFLSAGALLGAQAHDAADHPPLVTLTRGQRGDHPVHVVGVAREDAARTATGVTLTLDVVSVDD